MPKLILMVDPDASLRQQVAKDLEARGYEVQENADGREVLEQIRKAHPSAVILNVELPKGSGYTICSKLRKDDSLKHTRVLLTSTDATQKAFDDHRKLKLGRADDYLLKPFAVEALSRKLAALLGDDFDEALLDTGLTSLEPEDGAGDERISLEDIEEISVDEELSAAPSSLPGEGDVDLLETAFQQLENRSDSKESTEGEDPKGQSPPLLDLAADEPLPTSLHDQANEVLQALESDLSETGRLEVHSKRAAAAVEPLDLDDESSGSSPAPDGAAGRDKEYFHLKEKLTQRERELLRLREELNGREKDLLEQRDHETKIERELSRKTEELGKRDGQIRQLQQRVEALVTGQRRSEKDLQVSRERSETAAQLASELEGAQRRLAEVEGETEQLRSRNEEADTELKGLRAQLAEANVRLEDLRHQLDRSGDEEQAAQQNLRRNLSELEEEKQKNEERLVKAYQQLQDGERVRDKTKQALRLALQLLDEGPTEPDEAEDDQRN